MGSCRVLVVEDEWLIAQDYRVLLSRAGHVVVGPAATSASAMALLDNETVDLGLLDYQLSEETSAAVAERLTRERTPFIVVTGHSEVDLPEQFSRGVVVAKPVAPEVLLDLVDRLGNHRDPDPQL
jgi:DNA-binding NtrC family response regulator